ncbi:MAG: hypothetical protein H7A51_19105 [Akkermansiaceae bacterium]|nr:hypothetical protein [Akkermansiaceae bacterium]
MKTITTLAIVALALPCLGEEDKSAPKPVAATRPPSHKELAKTRKEQEIERYGEERKPIKPLVNIRKRDLFAISTLFSYRGYWGMVPKNAVIYVPPHLKDKIVQKPKGKLLHWPLFLQKNGGWIHTHEVSMAQAKGKEKVDQKAIEAYKGLNKIVVATYHRQPITVKAEALLPPEDPNKATVDPKNGNKKPNKLGPQ